LRDSLCDPSLPDLRCVATRLPRCKPHFGRFGPNFPQIADLSLSERASQLAIAGFSG
jgi:hypothetical protein